MPNFIEIIQLYLIPFAIAIPIVLLIVFFTTRRSEAPQIPDIDTQFPASAVNAFNSAKAINTERVYIGDHPDREGPSTVPGALRSAPAGPISLLVVDDSAVPRAKLRKLFEGNGYVVETANDGVQALELMAKSAFDVVVTDLEMPVMDGFELIAAIQGNMETEDIPIIAVTGHEEMSARVHTISGLYGIFKKPWNDRELLKRVETLAKMRKA